MTSYESIKPAVGQIYATVWKTTSGHSIDTRVNTVHVVNVVFDLRWPVAGVSCVS